MNKLESAIERIKALATVMVTLILLNMINSCSNVGTDGLEPSTHGVQATALPTELHSHVKMTSLELATRYRLIPHSTN